MVERGSLDQRLPEDHVIYSVGLEFDGASTWLLLVYLCGHYLTVPIAEGDLELFEKLCKLKGRMVRVDFNEAKSELIIQELLR